ncbi:MAG: pilus assembly protein PilM [Tepidisphaeraceae bacterium]
MQVRHAGHDRPLQWHAFASLPRDATGMPTLDELERVAIALRQRGFDGTRVVIAAPQSALFTDVIDTPPPESNAPVMQIVRSEMARGAQLANEPFVCQFWPLPKSARAGSSSQVMAVAFKESGAAPYVDLFAAAGLDLCAIDSPASALARACSPVSTDAQLVLLADLGALCSNLVLASQGRVVYQRSLADFGMDALARELAGEFSLQLDEAVAMLDTVGAVSVMVNDPASSIERQAIENSIRSKRIRALIAQHLDGLAREINVSIEYAGHRFPQLPIEALSLSGGGAGLAGVSSYLTNVIGLPVEPAHEADVTIGPSIPVEPLTRAAGLMALGLALNEGE